MSKEQKKMDVSYLGLLVVLALIFCLFPSANLSAAAFQPFPLSPDSPVIARSLNFLKTCQKEDGGFGEGGITEWVMIAISAAGQDPKTWKKEGNSPIDYLRKHFQPSTIWDYERIVLALSCAEVDPRNFGGINYLEKLKQFFRDGQIGDPLSLRDDFWGILALAAAGEGGCPEAKASAAFIKKHQEKDGSWGATTTGMEVCADNTAVAIMALRAAGENTGSPAIKNGIAYLKSVQSSDGGFPYLFVPSNAATDAWVIQALASAGENPTGWHTTEGGPVNHLLSLQESDGSFKWTQEETDSSLLMTAYALTALTGNVYHSTTQKTDLTTVSVRIEGRASTLYDGTLTFSKVSLTDSKGNAHSFSNPTALGVLEIASREGKFDYTVDHLSLGLYVSKIGGESDHWEYRLNNRLPLKGADKRLLHNGDEVLWFLNEKSFNPLKVSVDRKEVLSGETLNVRVESFTGSGWVPSDKGSLWVNSRKYDYEKGTVRIPFLEPGKFSIYGEAERFIRSAKKTVQVWPDRQISTYLRIQGKGQCIWEGRVNLSTFVKITDMDAKVVKVLGHSIIGALAQAASLGSFKFQVKQTPQGLIIVSIADYAEDNRYGSWWYEVNGKKVTRDVDEVKLEEGDSILLYYDQSTRKAD
jgi:prenyltransferase beta subunit